MTKRIPHLAVLALAALPLSAPARAADKTIDLPALRTMVGNLGYQDSSDDKNSYISINSVNNSDYAISLRVAGDNSGVFLDIPFASIPKDKVTAPPLSKLLKFNDTSVSYFSFSTSKDDLFFPELQTTISAGELSPQSLRTKIDQLVAEADATKELWDFTKWPAQTATAK